MTEKETQGAMPDVTEVRVDVSGGIDQSIRAEVMRQLGDSVEWKVKRSMDDLRRPLQAVDPVVLPIISLGVALAGFAYTIWKDRNSTSTWTAERLQEHLSNELIVRNIVDFEIVEVNNFDAFRSGKELCTVTGQDKKGQKYKVWVLLDGDVAALKLSKEPNVAV